MSVLSGHESKVSVRLMNIKNFRLIFPHPDIGLKNRESSSDDNNDSKKSKPTVAPQVSATVVIFFLETLFFTRRFMCHVVFIGIVRTKFDSYLCVDGFIFLFFSYIIFPFAFILSLSLFSLFRKKITRKTRMKV